MSSHPQIAGCVYLVTNTVNGKQYVGQTKKSIKRRWSQHRCAAKKGESSALYNAIRKYGADNFTIERIEEVVGIHADLVAAEIRQIASYDCVRPNGYNLTRGGDGVDFTVPEVKAKMVEAARVRAQDPEWLRKTTEASRKRSLDPDWIRANAEGALNRVVDPKVQREGMIKRSENPQWKQANSENNRRMAQDPEWQAAQLEGSRKRSVTPEWQTLRAEGLRKYNESPEGRAQQAEVTRKALEKDASCTPQEAAKRIREREYMRRKRAARKLVDISQ